MRENPDKGHGPAAPPERPACRLSELIHPVAVETFVAEYWERKPLVVKRGDPGYYAGLMTLQDVDDVLSTSSLRSSDLRVVAEGRETPVSQLVSPQAGTAANGLEVLFEQYRSGATINLTYLHERWRPLTDLCRALAAELSCSFQSNLYLTPPGARGLTPHYDTHDVLAVQIHGSKHWRIYESPERLPMAGDAFRMPPGGPGGPVREFDLEPGDLLYLPRGYVHDATSNQDASVHLTVGILPLHWATLLRDAVERAIAGDVRLRESLPPGFAVDPGLRQQAQSRLAALLADLGEQAEPAVLIGRAARKAMLGRQPVLHHHLQDLEELRSSGLDTPVRRREELLWNLESGTDAITLEFHGKSIRLPGRLEEEVRFVLDEPGRFTPREITGGLDEPGRLLLAQTLLREGFLTFA